MTMYAARLGSYHFGLSKELPESELSKIIGALKKPIAAPKRVLGGRGQISTTELEGVGSVVIKHYKRGGFLRYLGLSRYLRFGPTRPEREYDYLQKVLAAGVQVPEPIGFVYEGSIFYKGWLITKRVESEQSLAEISVSDPPRARKLVLSLAQQITRLIEERIYHVDLHAGNVLVDPQDNLFLIDFDKAIPFKGTRNKLRDQYLFRWRRAVIKHQLPEILSELVCSEVRRNYDNVK
ncbi:MAG: hypothetical protein KDD62_05460 [Bdellovibrionales bacterium]|nr:hypothetical protein [Bdellovibrionales bacterium]